MQWAHNGESVIIGGLIENKNEQIEQKVPVFGDIPVVGNLFIKFFKQLQILFDKFTT